MMDQSDELLGSSFQGFKPAVLNFLRELKLRNSKRWFETHRRDYQLLLLEPFQALVGDLSGIMLGIDPDFETQPAVNKTLSRIRRDTRFSPDKTLYRDRMWFAFKRRVENWQDSPTYFFQITPNDYEFGMGYYSASATTMRTFREQIDEDPERFLTVADFLTQSPDLQLLGEKYKRVINSSHPPEIQNWYQRKNFYIRALRKPDDILYSSRLVDLIADAFLRIAPLYQYLLDVWFRVQRNH
jgi:uncharacterized protein (TIGR02453 family)